MTGMAMTTGQEPPPRTRRRSLLPLGVVVAVVALVAALLSFGLGRDPTAIRSPLLGRPAPDFTLHTLDGFHSLHLAELRGQVVVLTFWASWCTECRVEQPDLTAIWDRFRDAGMVLVGVDFQDSPPDALGYVAETNTTWPVVADPGSRTALRYGVYGIPETFVIGPDGHVEAKHVGAVTYDQLVLEATRLLTGAPR